MVSNHKIARSEVPNHEKIVIEYGPAFGGKRQILTLTNVEDKSPSWVDKPLEVTGIDGENKYRIYLDKNKVELVNDKDGDFVGCIGTLYGIYEPF